MTFPSKDRAMTIADRLLVLLEKAPIHQKLVHIMLNCTKNAAQKAITFLRNSHRLISDKKGREVTLYSIKHAMLLGIGSANEIAYTECPLLTDDEFRIKYFQGRA
jgi:hypothetical protein